MSASPPGRSTAWLAKASLRVLLATGLVAALGIARDMVIAAEFGTSAETDLYALAFGLAGALALTMASASQLIVTPRLARSAFKGARGSVWLRTLELWFPVWWVALGAGIGLVLLAVLSPGALSLRQLSPSELSLSSMLLMSMAALPFGFGLSAVWSVVARYRGWHGRATLVIGLRGLGSIIFIVLAGRYLGILSVSLGLLLGLIFELLILWRWIRTTAAKSGDRPSRTSTAADTPIPGVRSESLAAFAVPLLPTVTFLTDKIVASQGIVGTTATLEFAYKLIAMPHYLLGMSLVTVAFVEIGKKWKDENRGPAERTAAESIGMILMATGPASILLWGLSDSLVALLFGYGQMTSSDEIRVASCLRYYSPGLLPLGIGALLSRFAFMAGQGWRAAQLAIGMGVANLVLDIVAFDYMGLPGIPLVTTLVSVAWMIGLGLLPCNQPVVSSALHLLSRYCMAIGGVHAAALIAIVLSPVLVPYRPGISAWPDSLFRTVGVVGLAGVLFAVMYVAFAPIRREVAQLRKGWR